MTDTALTPTAPGAASGDAFELLRRMVAVLLAWSYEGTFRGEQIVRRVGRRYGVTAEATIGADSAILTADGRTASFSHFPTVPPLDQVADFRALLFEIDDGALTAAQATARLDALLTRPPRFSNMVELFTALAVGMLVAAAAVRATSGDDG